jgi:hypothetical protein
LVKELAMRPLIHCSALLALMFAASRVAAQAPAPAGDQPKEESVEPFDSRTTGAVELKGDTKDWYEVLKDGKRAYSGAPPLLNNMVELSPGEYEVAINKTTRPIKIEKGKKLVLLTGALVVEGRKANFYAPYQGTERKVSANPRKLNTPMSLLPDTYRVELNVDVNRQVVLSDGVKVVAGKKTVLKE